MTSICNTINPNKPTVRQRLADRILVLANGKVEAAGTHEELIAQPGRYSELFELQAAGYR